MTVGESLSRFKVSMANYQSRTATRWTVPVLVGILTAQMLQSAHARDIGAQLKQSTPTGAADAEICGNAWITPRVYLANC